MVVIPFLNVKVIEMNNSKNMKNLIQKYLEIDEKLHGRADEIYRIWCRHFNGGNGSVSNLEFNQDRVDIIWEDSWQYGGHDNGRFSVPIGSFCGDWRKWIVSEIETNENLKSEREKRIKLNKIIEEKKQLRQLQDKYKK